MRDQNSFIRTQNELMLGWQGIQHFGNYDLVRRIARGGMGEVYLARQHTAFGREVAVKIIRSDLVHDMTARKRFLREAEVNAYLKHDHILPLVEFGEEQGRLFLVTPYIQGGTLLQRLRAGPLPLIEAYQLFTALVEAVAYLHKRGVIHRDLKPSNILLDRAEDSKRVYVRLIDFGIATLQGLSASAPLTMAGHEMGTAAYMAPERLDGVAASSNDIYSLGVILYQMITGQLPKAGELLSLPKPLDYVVAHAITANPHERFASADELLTHFEQAYSTVKSSSDINQPLIATSNPPLLSPVESVLQQSTPPLSTKALTHSASFNSATTVQPDKNPSPAEPLSPSSLLKKTMLDSAGSLATAHSEVILPPLPGKGVPFTGADYGAPTSSLDRVSHWEDKPVPFKAPSHASSKNNTRNRSLMAIITTLILMILLAMGGLGYQAFQASILANITISPRVQAISTVFTITAKPELKNMNVASSSIPAGVFTSTQISSQQGKTTGTTDCIFDFLDFRCNQAVSPSDIQMLSSQIQPELQSKIDQDLQKQAQTINAMTVGNTIYSNETAIANPQVGTASKTVNVTMTGQGSIEYIKPADAHNLALLLLKKKLSPHYALIDSLTQIGQPVVQQVNLDGTIQVAIAVGGVARYQIPASELTDMQNHLQGLTRKDARAQIIKHVNIDPTTIGIRISYGDTIPTNVLQIRIETLNPSNLPTVQLTAI